MDEDTARDLARQLREHLGYTGLCDTFDEEVVSLIRCVEDSCAKVVEETPLPLLAVASPTATLQLIAAAVRGKI